MATQLFWDEPVGADYWDLCILGGEVLPGIAIVETDVQRKIDIKPIKGQDGGSLTDEGYKNAPVTITLQIWKEWQWNEWQRIQQNFHPRTKGGARDPLEIVHPEPNSKGVSQVYVQQLPPIRISKGVGTITLKCIEWFAKPKPKKTGKGYAKSTGNAHVDYISAKTQAEAGGAALNAMLLEALGGS